MVRALLSVAFAVSLAFAPLCGQAETRFTLKSANIELPVGDQMFPDHGPGTDAINNNCLACHSADMVLNQPAMTRAQWTAEVDKMRTAYKAPIEATDVGAIVDYLVGIRGVK
jgi:hypothetical protein